MKTNSIACLAIVSMVLFSGCSKPEGQKYFPQPFNGLKREFTIEYINTQDPTSSVQKGRMAYRIDGTETINGMSYFKGVVVFSGLPGLPTYIEYTRMDKQGVHVIDGKDETKTDCLSIPFPVKVGDSWTVKRFSGEYQYRVESIETLQLFDRKYDDCLKIAYKGQNTEGYAYYAPGIGEVKEVFVGYGKTMEFVLDKR